MKGHVRPAPLEATVTTEDGFPLSVYVFEADDPQPRLVIISPANGVPGRFYFSFAQWLATQGFTVLTWDWRGLGSTTPESLRGFDASMSDWARLDQPAVLNWAQQRYDLPLVAIGHSFGGQIFGLAGCPTRFAKVILFGSSNAYWRLWPAPDRYIFRAWISAMRCGTFLTGYGPGKGLGLGANLPAGVAKEWLRWCLHPDYHQDWQGHAEIKAPVMSVAFSDDLFAPLAARLDLLSRYGGSKSTITLTPQEFGLRKVGHFDFFRRRYAETLWPALLPFLEDDAG